MAKLNYETAAKIMKETCSEISSAKKAVENFSNKLEEFKSLLSSDYFNETIKSSEECQRAIENIKKMFEERTEKVQKALVALGEIEAEQIEKLKTEKRN